MVSATSWFVFFTLILAFNIANAQVPYGALAGVGAALETLGPVGAILALESGLPLGGLGLGAGGLPFPAGTPFLGDFNGVLPGQGYPGIGGTGLPFPAGTPFLGDFNGVLPGQGYPGGYPGLGATGLPFPTGIPFTGDFLGGFPGQGYPGPIDGFNYPTPIPSKGLDNGFYGSYPGQFSTGFEGQPTYFNIPVQETTQVTESVTLSETTSFPNGYYDANQGFPFGFGGNQYEAALAPEAAVLNGYNGNYFGPYPGQGFSGANGGITQVVPVAVPEPIYVPEPILVPEPYPVPVPVSASSGGFPNSFQSGYPSFPGSVSGYSQPAFSGAIPSGFSGLPSPATTSYQVGPSFSGSLPPVYPSALPSYPGPLQTSHVPPQFPGGYCGDYSVGFPSPAPPAYPGPISSCYPQGPITVIEECDNDNSFSKLLPLLLILSLSGNNCC